LIDFDDAPANDWLAVNQFTVIEGRKDRRPDVVVFINGLPLGVIELKNASDETATLETAFRQFDTYRSEIPSLFRTNAVLVISGGVFANLMNDLVKRFILAASGPETFASTTMFTAPASRHIL
jgi:type I restriction enzyme, R subunit